MNLINTLRMYAEDMHSATGYSERSSAMSLAADRIEQIESAIDAEMVATHLGVFGEQDDPKKALNSLMVWSESVGGYFAKEKIKELEQERDSLAAQNEGMREAIELYFKQYPHMMKGYILDAINSPNLATEVLKRRDAATLRRAAEHFDKAIGLVAGDGKETLTAIELRRMAAEIEKETT